VRRGKDSDESKVCMRFIRRWIMTTTLTGSLNLCVEAVDNENRHNFGSGTELRCFANAEEVRVPPGGQDGRTRWVRNHGGEIANVLFCVLYAVE